ncbi:hypothetical protein ACFSQ7_39875 [Paenibacillus rhizoplanae]
MPSKIAVHKPAEPQSVTQKKTGASPARRQGGIEAAAANTA